MSQVRSKLVNSSAGLIQIATGFTALYEETLGAPAQYHSILRFQGTLPAIAGGASLAIGRKFLTLPVGIACTIREADLQVAVKGAVANAANTPDCGIGTTIGTGAISTLTTTMQDIVNHFALGDAAGTQAENATVANKVFLSGASSRDLFLNACAAWTAVDAAALIYGVFRFNWTRFG